MKERARNLLVGITSIASLIGLAFILLMFGYVPALFEPGYTVKITLNNAANMSKDSPIRYRGVTIGKIEEIKLLGDAVELRAKITYRVNGKVIGIPRDVKVDVESPFLGSSPFLVLDDTELDEAQRREVLPQDDSARLTGHVVTSTGGLANQFRAMMAGPLEKFETLSAEWTEVATNLNHLIEPRSTQEVDDGTAPGNLTSVLARADARLAEMKEVLHGLNEWMNDESLRNDVRTTAANTAELSQELRQVVGDAGKQIDSLTKRYIAVADDLSQTIRSTQQVIDKANNGEGTIGKFLNDPAVFNNLNDALERVNAAVKDVRLLIEKWKKEGVPVRL